MEVELKTLIPIFENILAQGRPKSRHLISAKGFENKKKKRPPELEGA
jgi:hypothetical protein